MIITFDGVDGAGKTTLVSALGESLRDKGYDVLKHHFPTTDDPMTGVAREARIFRHLADMAQVNATVFDPFMAENPKGIILVDRYKWTTFAYNIWPMMPDEYDLMLWSQFLRMSLPDPDLSFYVTISHETSYVRKGEKTPEEYFTLTDGYNVAHEIGELSHIIDGESPVGHNVGIVETLIKNLMSDRGHRVK